MIDREAAEDDEPEGLSLKKGDLVLMSVYELHRHRNFWKEPETYDPDRFEEINTRELSNFYYPFGAGPRMCIGNNFAMYEMIMTIARIIADYEISTPLERMEINPLISLKPKTVPLSFALRRAN